MKRQTPPAPPPKPLSVERLLEQHQPSTSGLDNLSSSALPHKSCSTSTSSSSGASIGIINPVFVSDLVEESETRIPLPTPSSSASHHKHQQSAHSPVHSAKSSISIESSSGRKQSPANNNRRTVTIASSSSNQSHTLSHRTGVKHLTREDELSCDHCSRYHASHHLGSPTKVPEVRSRPISYPSVKSYHPSAYVYTPSPQPPPPVFSPASYYLLGSDSRRHKHTHYRRNCRTCRQIVRETFERYYLHNTYPYLPYQQTMVPSTGTTSRNSNGSGGSLDTNNNARGAHHGDEHDGTSLLKNTNRNITHAPPPSTPFVTLLPSKRRANCGHSCLKYTILFYSSIAVILAICAICYLTRMFGYLSDQMAGLDQVTAAATGSTLSPIIASSSFDRQSSSFNVTADLRLMDNNDNNNNLSPPIALPTGTGVRASLLEVFPPEIIGIIIASAVMIIFCLGLIGAFMESILCLRIFGAILSYLFLLTFGAALYVVILMVISRLPAKLVLSTISCSVVAITIHAAIAIAPFAFADLLYQEKEDERNEYNTYYKYPSVRFLPLGASKSALNYFSLPFMTPTGPSSHNAPNFRLRDFGPSPTGHYIRKERRSPSTAAVVGGTTTSGSSSARSSPRISSNGKNEQSQPNHHHHHHRHHRRDEDSHSLESLLPVQSNHREQQHREHHNGAAASGSSQMVRFNDNWI